MVAYVRNGGHALMAELPNHLEARRRAIIYHNATKESSGTNLIRYTVHADVRFAIKGDSIQQAQTRLNACNIPYVRASDYRDQWKLGFLSVNIDITDWDDQDLETRFGFILPE